jgi:Ca2+-binding RTX toxin-like protein
MTRRLVLACGLALLGAAPASAATVTGHEGQNGLGFATVRDSRGERNRLQILAGRTLVIRERRQDRLDAAGTCDQVDPRTVRCAEDVLHVRVRAGDGDDQVEVLAGAISISLAGQAGDDDIHGGHSPGGLWGGEGEDVLRGGPGRQTIRGGPGDDRLSGGSGRDVLHGDDRGPFGDDVLDGGAGGDKVTYEERRTPVVVDLTRQVASSPDDADRLRSIEHAVGGRRSDRLVGTEARNRLYGGNGRDTLIGRGGDDRLDVSGLLTRYDPGDDGDRDRMDCGPGDDVVAGAARGLGGARRPEPIERDCERLAANDFGDLDGHVIRVQPLRVERGRALVPVTCTEERSSCRRRATVRAGGARLGRSVLVRVRAGVRRVAVPLRRPLPDRGVVEIRVSGPDGHRLRYRLRR